MYDITQPHYSGFLGFQEQLCSHYVVIVLNIAATLNSEYASLAQGQMLSQCLWDERRGAMCASPTVLTGSSPESSLDAWGSRGSV